MKKQAKKVAKISMIAGSAVLLVSGCAQGASGGGSSNQSGGTTKATGTISYAGGWATNGVVNPFGTNNIIQNDLSYVPLAWYKYTGNYDYWKVLATSWKMSKDGKTFTVNINPKAKWSDGSALTAEDVYVTFELQLLTGAAEGWGLNGMKIVNDHTIEFTRDPKTLYSTVMFERQILNNVEILPAKVFKQYIPSDIWTLTKEWNGDPNAASTKAATSKLTQAATKAQSVNMKASDLIYNGPWSLVRTSSSQELYQKNPNYLYANNVTAAKVVAI
ncbi:ABC transporter substrate-binding protein, partial [Alicyclobacillus fodiniaquatilis]